MLESVQQAGTLSLHVAMGIALASCAGLRAFLPLLVVGIAGRMEWVHLGESFAWISHGPALVVFGVALVAELLADKIPAVDHALDALATVLKPVAGGLLAAAITTDWAPLYLVVASTVAGAAGAGAVHVAKAKLRLVSSVTTAGIGNPLLSVVEDAVALVASLVALVAPLLVALGWLAGIVLVLVMLRRLHPRAPRTP